LRSGDADEERHRDNGRDRLPRRASGRSEPKERANALGTALAADERDEREDDRERDEAGPGGEEGNSQ
jgi:hypothetical protein